MATLDSRVFWADLLCISVFACLGEFASRITRPVTASADPDPEPGQAGRRPYGLSRLDWSRGRSAGAGVSV